MNSDDINREIEAMWHRVHKSDVPAPSTPAGAGEGPAPRASVVGEFEQNTTAETVRILKRQHRETDLYYREMLAAKDKETDALKERLKDLEERVESLQRDLNDREQETMAVTVQTQVWAEEQSRSLANLKEAHKQEVAALNAAAEEVREKLRQQGAGREKQSAEWKRREEDLQARLRELEALPNKLKGELRKKEAEFTTSSSEAETARKRAAQSLGELQEAVRKSTEELLRERGVRKEAEEGKARTESELVLLKDAHERMKAAWAEERRQWTELWERERSTWEAQRQEMRQWEDDLRKQRDEWLTAIRPAPQGGGVERETELSPSPALRATSPGSAGRGEWRRRLPWRRIAAGAAVVLVLVGGVLGVRRALRGIYLKLESTTTLPLQTPTSLAWDGAHLWVGSWSGLLAVFDPNSPAAPMWQSVPKGIGPFRPGGLAVGDGALWSLDAAQVRILKHDPRNPSRVLWKSREGSLPSAIAHDGKRLWVFEGSERNLYRYRVDPKLGPEETYALARGLTATSMQWEGKDLWLFDALNAELWRYRLEGRSFSLKSRDKLPAGTVAAAVSDRQIWALSAEGGKAALRRYRRIYP